MPVGFAQTTMCDTIFLGANTATTIYPGQNNGAQGTQLFDNAAARETGVAGRLGQYAIGLAAVGAGMML
jgi:hypothetical protein